VKTLRGCTFEEPSGLRMEPDPANKAWAAA
jgi:hypothetical protein